MKILIGVCMGMLLGGGGVWAFHDSRPLDRYEGVVNPLALPEVKPVKQQHLNGIKPERPQETPCKR